MRNNDWRSLLRYESGSVMMIIFGILLTFKPDFASGMVSMVLGWILIAMGVSAIVMGFVGRLGLGPILSGALMLLSGSWLHSNPMMIASAIGIMQGIVVLLQGLKEMRQAARVKRYGGFWILGAVLATVEVLVGIRLILSPLLMSRLVLRICGIIMVLCGLGNLTAFDRSRQYLDRSNGNIIDAD